MSDLMLAIGSFLSNSWKFFTQTDVPGTNFSFAVLFIGLALIPISLTFLSLILGFPVGLSSDAPPPTSGYGARGTRHMELPPARKNDTR